MPNRIIKESLLISESYAKLTLFERDLFIRLIVAVDDYGRFDARPAIIKGRLMPLEEKVSQQKIAQALEALAAKGLIEIYEKGGRSYLWLTGWERHQNIRAKRSKFPEPEGLHTSASNCTQMQADAPVIQSESESNPESKSESESESEPAGAWRPPTVLDVARYCKEKALNVDADKVCAYYQAQRWRTGGVPVRNWRALLQCWSRSTGPPVKKVTQQQYTQREHHELTHEEDADLFMEKIAKLGGER